MATASVSYVSTSGSKGNYEVGKGYFGYGGRFSSCYSTYMFTLTAPTTSLSINLSVDVLGASQTYAYRIDTSSSNTDSFTQQGTFTGAAGNSSSFRAQTYSFTATGSFTAQTYYLHMKCNTSNAGYFHLSSGTVTYSPTTYTVSYNANGGTGAPSAQTKEHGTALTLSSTTPTKSSTTATGYTVTFNGNGGTPSVTSATATDTTSYTFSSWNTAANGSGTSYSAGGAYTANASATLYAQYSGSTTKGSVALPTAAQYTRAGFNLLGFATGSTATTAAYAPGTSYTPSANVTLYAVWKADGLVYIDNGTSLEAYQVFIDNGSGWDQYAPHIDNGSAFVLYS